MSEFDPIALAGSRAKGKRPYFFKDPDVERVLKRMERRPLSTAADIRSGRTLFNSARASFEIETGSDLTLGMTVADWWRVTGRAPNALFLGTVDADGFYALLTERLARL